MLSTRFSNDLILSIYFSVLLFLTHSLQADTASAAATIQDIGCVCSTSKWCDSVAFMITSCILYFLNISAPTFACDSPEETSILPISCSNHAFLANRESNHNSHAISSDIFATSLLCQSKFCQYEYLSSNLHIYSNISGFIIGIQSSSSVSFQISFKISGNSLLVSL
jgi:hypothetical protein